MKGENWFIPKAAQNAIFRRKIVPVFEKLIDSYNSADPRCTLAEKAALLEILRLFMSNVDYISILPENTDDFIATVNEHVMRNISSAITLRDLAGIVHLHPNYFIQYFRKRYNVSPIGHVKTMRLEKAAQLLVQFPERSVGEIAMEVGFRDYRYFSRIFRKRYGITPSTYKNWQVLSKCQKKVPVRYSDAYLGAENSILTKALIWVKKFYAGL